MILERCYLQGRLLRHFLHATQAGRRLRSRSSECALDAGRRDADKHNVNELHEIFAHRRNQCAEILETLLAAPAFRFDDSLRPRLPVKHGLYVIARRDRPKGEYLHAGKSLKAKEGLRSRVWSQHFTQGGNRARSDLVQKVIDKGYADGRATAQTWIRANCLVQWLVEEDEDSRCWAEHYMLSVLRPIWGR